MTTHRTNTTAPATLRRSLGAVAGLMLGFAALPAVAATCETDKVSFSLTQGAAEIGSLCDQGNDNWKDGTEVFSLTGWVMAQKVEGGAAGAQEGDVPSFDLAPVAKGEADWAISNPGAYANLVLVLKQASGFRAFLLDAEQELSGTWGTEGPGKSVGDLSHATLWYRPGGARIETGIFPPEGDAGQCCPCEGTLSRSVLTTSSSCNTDGGGRDDGLFPPEDGVGVGVVPLPAAGWLLLGGMGLLGGLGWRRSRRA